MRSLKDSIFGVRPFAAALKEPAHQQEGYPINGCRYPMTNQRGKMSLGRFRSGERGKSEIVHLISEI
jgi:hypothetical protein